MESNSGNSDGSSGSDSDVEPTPAKRGKRVAKKKTSQAKKAPARKSSRNKD